MATHIHSAIITTRITPHLKTLVIAMDGCDVSHGHGLTRFGIDSIQWGTCKPSLQVIHAMMLDPFESHMGISTMRLPIEACAIHVPHGIIRRISAVGM
jgi:hypothetical protein